MVENQNYKKNSVGVPWSSTTSFFINCFLFIESIINSMVKDLSMNMKKIIYVYVYILIGYSFLLYLSSFLWMFQAIWLFVGLVFFLDIFLSLFRDSEKTRQERWLK